MTMKRENEKLPGIDESYRLLTFEYAFRQVGFIVLLGIIVAAIAGLFSSGMVSDTVKTNSSKEGANKQVISSQADSLIKISRIWADFFPANTSNQPI